MGCCLEQCLWCALLNDAALVNHRHLVAQVVDHRQVVADEQVGDAELLRQVLHQVEYLRLHRDVERTDRFVRHDQAGPGDQRPGNRHALALPARKFMRVFVQIVAAQTHSGQYLGRLFAHGGGGLLA